MDGSEMSDKIRHYWDERARDTDPASAQATTYDVFLRELEIATLKDKILAAALPQGSTVVDLGCGDGYSTISLAAAFPTVGFIGIDWSQEMLALAEQRLSTQSELLGRVSFRRGDMRCLSDSVKAGRFEAFLTMRSLINLTSSAEQYNALMQIAEHLKAGGYYFGIENFVQGQDNFNRLRVAVGLPEIPVRWHNHFFDEEEFVRRVEDFFDSVVIESFSSSYYLATRVIYSAGCQSLGEEPDYFHPIHKTAGRLPVIGDFSPIKLVSMRRKLLSP
jgi:ubiquinone/menaquinone biosynthesis C-methylase UbiE